MSAHRAALELALTEVQAHVGQLDVRVVQSNVRLRVDGRDVGILPLSRPLRLLPGTVVVSVSAEGYAPTTRSVTVTAGQLSRERFELALLGALAQPAVALPAVTPVVALPAVTPVVAPAPTRGHELPPVRAGESAVAPSRARPTGWGESAPASVTQVAPLVRAVGVEVTPSQPGRGDISRGMGALLPGARSCAGDQVGLATANVELRSDGTVVSASVTGVPFGGTPQASCMESVIRRARFSPFTSAAFRFAYPLAIR